MFKMLLFDAICQAIKAGALNLRNENTDAFLSQADLTHLKCCEKVLRGLKQKLVPAELSKHYYRRSCFSSGQGGGSRV